MSWSREVVCYENDLRSVIVVFGVFFIVARCILCLLLRQAVIRTVRVAAIAHSHSWVGYCSVKNMQ